LLQNNYPAYKVKIWGYKTAAEAEKEAAKLQKKYKVPFKVD